MTKMIMLSNIFTQIKSRKKDANVSTMTSCAYMVFLFRVVQMNVSMAKPEKARKQPSMGVAFIVDSA